jgi:hypothetical protein
VNRTLLLALAMPSSGCTLNVYWTDYVVHGELYFGQYAGPRREPIPFALSPTGEGARRDDASPTATTKGAQR